MRLQFNYRCVGFLRSLLNRLRIKTPRESARCYSLIIPLLFLINTTWVGLWWTPDQQGQRSMDHGDFVAAVGQFRDPFRQGAAWFRAGEFEAAEQAFARVASAEAEFNRGNCLIMLGKYEPAIERFDRALELRPDWDDAIVNREIAAVRAERVKQEGGDMGNQKIGADEIRFDKKKSGGQETVTDATAPLPSNEMQALWLRRVQTNPADFLKAKFSYQITFAGESEQTPTDESQ